MVRAQHLPAALERGDASWDDVDRAVERIVATLLRFDDVLSRAGSVRRRARLARHRALAREVAARSVVLLRNEPVDGVAGPALRRAGRHAGRGARAARATPSTSATVARATCGTSTATPCSTGCARPSARSCTTTAPTSSVRRASPPRPTSPWWSSATRTSTRASTSVRPTRRSPRCSRARTSPRSSSGSRLRSPSCPRPRSRRTSPPAGRRSAPAAIATSLRLPPADVELIRAVAAANPRTVVVIQAGSAVIASEWIDAVPAVVQAWYGGCQAGPGLADVLLGAVNPSARLPFSVPVDEADLPPFDRDATRFRYDRWHGWWHLARHGTTPAFPFGFGLSYTTFALTDVEVTAGDGRGGRARRGAEHRRAGRSRRRAGLRRAARPGRARRASSGSHASRCRPGERPPSRSRSRGTASPPGIPTGGRGARRPVATASPSPAGRGTRARPWSRWSSEDSGLKRVLVLARQVP